MKMIKHEEKRETSFSLPRTTDMPIYFATTHSNYVITFRRAARDSFIFEIVFK